ncbi:MAG TPA: PHP domain-containing protein [Dissulfurispiraceae bacterium]
MRKFVADLHIHSCLSPCAEVDMTPRRIIDAAVEKGIDIIAISDHNSAENLAIAVKIAQNKGVMVVPAMEITSYEEAHVLALFGSLESALSMQEIVYRHLPGGVNDERYLGYQLVVNEVDEIVGFNKRLLVTTTGLSMKDLVDTIHSLGGLAVASHIDREAFSIISQLGFISDDMAFDALEISSATDRERAGTAFGGYAHFPWLTSSDAHNLRDIGRKTVSLLLEEASFIEIASALKAKERIEW